MTGQVSNGPSPMGRLSLIAMAALIGVVAAVTAAPLPVHATTTFVVNRSGNAPDNNLVDAKCDTSPNTGKQCTLRAAIQEANDTAGNDTINFNITTASKVIAPTSPLPPITETATINGYTQSGASANTQAVGNNAVLKIVLDGINAGANANGLELVGSKAKVRGLVIQRFKGSGVRVSGATAVLGCFIGTNAAGTAARGNGVGVTMTAIDGVVGGGAVADRNVISGNIKQGILVSGVGADSNAVIGNYIGTRKTGTVALPNGEEGVRIEDATGTKIGLASANYGNLISGNGGHGVFVFKDSGASDTVIQGNLIGTDATGTVDLGNTFSGVYTDALSVQVGGNTAGARNVISGNGAAGVALEGSDDNVIQGNLIGTKSDGTGDLGNGSVGILIESAGDDNTIGGSTSGTANVISGNDWDGISLIGGINNAVRGNVIRFNGRHGIAVSDGHDTIAGNVIFSNANDGIEVFGASASGIRISANQIFANGGLGIDLVGGTENAAKVTSNDAGDTDPGTNNLQNFPVLNSAVRFANGVTTVAGSLNSTASTGFTIELFMAVADASGHGEGQILVSTPQHITTNSAGNKNFTFQLGNLAAGMSLTATATVTAVSNGSTSEFSANTTVFQAP